MRVELGARAFAKLENWVAVPDGKHTDSGGMQGYRRRWKAQLDARRGHLTPRERGGPVDAADRWIELVDQDVAFIQKCRKSPGAGGFQRAIRDIFDGVLQLP